MTDRTVFDQINQNSADKVHKPTIQKSKIIKQWFFQTIDAGGASWWILAQKRPTTPKVLILMIRTHPMKNSSNINFLKNRLFLVIFEFNWSNFVSPYQHFWFVAIFLKDKKWLINVNENRFSFSESLLVGTSIN